MHVKLKISINTRSARPSNLYKGRKTAQGTMGGRETGIANSYEGLDTPFIGAFFALSNETMMNCFVLRLTPIAPQPAARADNQVRSGSIRARNVLQLSACSE
jgi:hypothetical protein